MENIMWRLGQISGMLEGLASMEGSVISSDVSHLLMKAAESLDGIADELMKRVLAFDEMEET